MEIGDKKEFLIIMNIGLFFVLLEKNFPQFSIRIWNLFGIVRALNFERASDTFPIII